jgi:hypothetical protein
MDEIHVGGDEWSTEFNYWSGMLDNVPARADFDHGLFSVLRLVVFIQ